MLFQKCQKKLFVIMIFKKEKETKDDFFKVNPAKTVEAENKLLLTTDNSTK